MQVEPYTYYDVCEATKTSSNKWYINHLKTSFQCGIICSRTESEYYMQHQGKVYISKEGKAIGYGLRARHTIKAGTKVMNFMSKGGNWVHELVCGKKRKVYYGRVWTFLEYYRNYGGLSREKNSKNSTVSEILATLKKLMPDDIKYIQEGLWVGYNKDTTTDGRKNEIRESKGTYKCACEYIHGVVETVECIGEFNGVNSLQIKLKAYGNICINMVGQGQLLFFKDVNCVQVLGVVESIHPRSNKFVVKTLITKLSNSNILILSKMILDPTFVGYCIDGKTRQRPSPDKIHSKTSDVTFNFNIDGTPLKTYYDVLKNRRKRREERLKARDILKQIGLAPFSNEPSEHSHASMIMPFVDVLHNFMPEDDLMEFPKTIRTTMHPRNVKLPQFVATYDIQNGEPLTWMYGWTDKDKGYEVGWPPRRTIVFKSNFTRKRQKIMSQFLLDNILNETSTPQVVFQYYNSSTENPRTILIPTVAEPNCDYTEHSSLQDLQTIVDKSGRCLKHNTYKFQFYGHDMEKQRMYPPWSYDFQWQKKYSIRKENHNVIVLYGGVPYFSINEQFEISALKPFFTNEFFDTTVCKIFSSFSHEERNLKLKKSTVGVVFDVSPKEVAIRNYTKLNLTGFVIYDESEEKSAVVTSIKNDRGNCIIAADKDICGWKKVNFYTVQMSTHINVGDFIHMSSELYDLVPHLLTKKSFKNLDEFAPYLSEMITDHNKRFL
jgi:hypothetical protein